MAVGKNSDLASLSWKIGLLTVFWMAFKVDSPSGVGRSRHNVPNLNIWYGFIFYSIHGCKCNLNTYIKVTNSPTSTVGKISKICGKTAEICSKNTTWGFCKASLVWDNILLNESNKSRTESRNEVSTCPTADRRKSRRDRMTSFIRKSRDWKHFWIGSWFSLEDTWSVKWRRQVNRPLEINV